MILTIDNQRIFCYEIKLSAIIHNDKFPRIKNETTLYETI